MMPLNIKSAAQNEMYALVCGRVNRCSSSSSRHRLKNLSFKMIRQSYWNRCHSHRMHGIHFSIRHKQWNLINRLKLKSLQPKINQFTLETFHWNKLCTFSLRHIALVFFYERKCDYNVYKKKYWTEREKKSSVFISLVGRSVDRMDGWCVAVAIAVAATVVVGFVFIFLFPYQRISSFILV